MNTFLRARVERLLRGDFRVDDITRLFLYARDRCNGSEPVQEIGDFVAHQDERTKGLITRFAREWYCIAKVAGEGYECPTDLNNLSKLFPDFLAASLRRQPKIIDETVGLTRKEAAARLPGIVEKLIRKSDGRLSISMSHSWDDLKLIETLANSVKTAIAFEGNRLFDEFAATLVANHLLHKKEVGEFQKIEPAVSLFAVSVMHNCDIVVADASRIRLKASADGGDTIAVWAPIPIQTTKLTGADHYLLSSAIFRTSLDGTFCEPELLATPSWDFLVEVTSNGRLGRLS